MSFTADIKNEISNTFYPNSEAIAELSAVVNIGAVIEKNSFRLILKI